jgi:ubiquinone/menaquinone biosynthesis C-methylase UbiE
MTTVRHPVFARIYSNLIVDRMDRAGVAPLRARALAGLSGTVVEVGAGDGANLTHYPPEMDHLVAVEPEPYLRDRVTARTADDRRVDVRDGTAEDLPVPDGSADAVVFTLVLCSVADVGVALREARRVLRAGGEVRLLEHVQSHEPGRIRGVQHALDATIWPRLFGGCHCGRDTARLVEDAGFTFTELDRLTVPAGSRGPDSAVILGRAVPAV